MALTAPPQPPGSVCGHVGAGQFLGREEQLARIRQALEAGDKPVVLWGFAGMGKTELAVELCRRWRRGRTYFVPVQGSVRQTVVGPIADASAATTAPTGMAGRSRRSRCTVKS